ncbi:MAG: EamA family transporter, partial [Pseudomonadales bacterium]
MSNKYGLASLARLSPELILFLVTIIAAIGWVISKAALNELQPFTFVGLRFSIAALVLLPFSWPHLKALNTSQWRRAVLTSLVFAAAMLIWIV